MVRIVQNPFRSSFPLGGIRFQSFVAILSWASLVGLASLSLGACAPAKDATQFDSAAYLRQQIASQSDGRVTADKAAQVKLPFELPPDLVETALPRLRRDGKDWQRAGSVVDYIFSTLKLQYAMAPTRDAEGTYTSRSGNCLSFVNLFVALGRAIQLNPFYVEVEDYQRWDHRQGMVISQGHVVAGLYIGGDLKTYDFMPYRVKSYKDFSPIEDLTATAHYYNNLGAEALLDGDMERAFENLSIAGNIDPLFVKGINNLGVWYARKGDWPKAIELYQRGLENHPENVPLISNLARAYQKTGRGDEANLLLAQLDGVRHNNPFFYVYKADMAMAHGDAVAALGFLREAYAIDTEASEVHLGLTRVYVAMGELGKAKHHLSRALKADPSHPEGRKLAAMLAPALQNIETPPEPPGR